MTCETCTAALGHAWAPPPHTCTRSFADAVNEAWETSCLRQDPADAGTIAATALDHWVAAKAASCVAALAGVARERDIHLSDTRAAVLAMAVLAELQRPEGVDRGPLDELATTSRCNDDVSGWAA